MKANLKISYRRSVGNLHVRPEGDFDGTGAWALFKTIRRGYNEGGRVFVNTAGLESIRPEAVALFKTHMTPKVMPLEKLYFKGKKGFDIGPDGSRVIVCKKGEPPLRKRCCRFRPRPAR